MKSSPGEARGRRLRDHERNGPIPTDMVDSPHVRPLVREEVPPGDFTEDDVKSLSGREWVAICFAAGLFLLIGAICIYLVFYWGIAVPHLEKIPPEAQREAIERYKDLSSVLSERVEKIFDLLVTKALLPIFATLIGFLLGKKTR